jgi:hypothetical protein
MLSKIYYRLNTIQRKGPLKYRNTIQKINNMSIRFKLNLRHMMTVTILVLTYGMSMMQSNY